jgi:hypothetical protein
MDASAPNWDLPPRCECIYHADSQCERICKRNNLVRASFGSPKIYSGVLLSTMVKSVEYLKSLHAP